MDVQLAVKVMRKKVLSGPSTPVLVTFSIFVLSLPPKWSTLHISSALLLLALLFARREHWRSPAMRGYILITCSWLVPVAVASVWQHYIGLETATTWVQLLRLAFRMLGVGMGIIFLLQRGWLSLRAAVMVMLCGSALNGVVGYVDWINYVNWAVHSGMGYGWRTYRMEGLSGNPNPFGTFMALALVLSVGIVRTRPQHALLWIMVLTTAVAIWASGSRGAVAAVLIGLFVLLAPRNRHVLIAFLVVLIGVMALVVVYAMSDPNFSGDHLRVDVAIYSLRKIMDAPLAGRGMHAFLMMKDRPDLNAPHDMLLDLAFSSGVVAVAGWLFSTGWLLTTLERSPSQNSRILSGVLAAAIVAGLLEYSVINSMQFQFIWLLVTVFACRVLYMNPDGEAVDEFSQAKLGQI